MGKLLQVRDEGNQKNCFEATIPIAPEISAEPYSMAAYKSFLYRSLENPSKALGAGFEPATFSLTAKRTANCPTRELFQPQLRQNFFASSIPSGEGTNRATGEM